MLHYRIYQIDRAGHIVRATDRECVDDEQACAAAVMVLPLGTRGDIWQRARFVRRVAAAMAAPPLVAAHEASWARS